MIAAGVAAWINASHCCAFTEVKGLGLNAGWFYAGRNVAGLSEKKLIAGIIPGNPPAG